MCVFIMDIFFIKLLLEVYMIMHSFKNLYSALDCFAYHFKTNINALVYGDKDFFANLGNYICISTIYKQISQCFHQISLE
jgi:hypothetical protein